jgi:hypothetical protein
MPTDHSAADYDAAQPDARRPEAVTKWAEIRLPPVASARKSAYVRAARPGKLNDWIIATLDRAAGYEPPAE